MLRFPLSSIADPMNHVMAPQAFLSVGLSFATVEILVNNTLTAHRRFYLPQEPLSSSLKKFWTEFGYPEKLTVRSRYLEKILDAKLGGSVAQVVTRGFETWPILRQPVFPRRFSSKPYRQEPLASQELIFGLSERLNCQGEILQPLDLSELEAINAKLKLMNVKRVCINLLFSQKNQVHQNLVEKYFQEQEFEVFTSARAVNSNDELPAWRKNIINACLSGAFSEHAEEIKKSFGEQSVNLQFLNNCGEDFLEDKNQITGSLFAESQFLQTEFRNQAPAVLNLGLENWSLLLTQKSQPFWESPWGRIELEIPWASRLRFQPSQTLVIGQWGGLTFSDVELGFEPGPISFGRAHKVTIFDVLQDRFQFPLNQIHPSGSQRYKDHLTALLKNNSQNDRLRPAQATELLIDELTTQLSLEIQFKLSQNLPRSAEKIKVVACGFFAPLLLPALSKKFFQINFLSKEVHL